MNRFLMLFSIIILLLSSCSDDPNHIEPPPPIPPVSHDTIWSDYLSPSYNLIKDSVWSKGEGCSYFVSAIKFYFNQDSRKNCFLGMLVNKDFDSNETINSIDSDLIYNKIICVGLDTLVFDMDFPNSYSMDSICGIIEKKYVQDELAAIGYNEYEYNTPKELYLKFAYNNIRLDSLIYNKGYNEAQMSKKHGYIFCVTQLYFDLSMDLPNQLVINEELIDKYDKSELSFVKSIWYGKMKYLVIESDYTRSEIKQCLSKMKNKEIMSQKEETIISTSLLSLITIDSNGNNVIKGGKEVINEYYINNSNDITGLFCTFSSYSENSVSEIKRKIDLIF